MSDLVERLRGTAAKSYRFGINLSDARLANEAAAEIERLTAANAALAERVKTLEEALGKLGDHYRNYGSSDEDDILLEIVEVALGGSNE